MQIRETSISGLVEIFPRVFEDERGFFFESYNEQLFKKLNLPTNFVQDNQSFSRKGVVRGLHFQKSPFSQGKLVRVISGRVLDVAVDIRPDSPTFGQHEIFELRSDTHNIAYIPEGFAHGFAALEDTIFSYKCTNVYNKESESGILWNDPDLGINWGVENPIVSEKDVILPDFKTIIAEIKASYK
ncbi:dTDP-4-dehydrorhamnose 3,5-epimerase [Dyadobacter sediminis]|uniref:dTDP-4-dehydrorhamnose 3,5-epimerase n=1 Tax=Dyadobacter sediminis TaxID=1493691 RepID=A0A5R9KDW6_9BACT|nr:dTDP-4-dehydrorhamnose 3,5-epimerase [Dyadobacter sediminis]TLU94345.1 dTDP-4-dehydrorhamnose 3,5-epimerase [Dyadobacter sediminis]GGB92089.1 dTDP-4-dehydrorhamnose 3,5-epimerase [Dyadobacter sediminis]